MILYLMLKVRYDFLLMTSFYTELRIKNPNDHEILQEDLNTLTKWANAWLMHGV